MSKMFDALKRAEAARRRHAGGNGERAQDHPQAEPTRSAAPSIVRNVPSANGSLPLSPEFDRELGLLRNSIDSILGSSGKRTIMVTGSSHEEGVTTLAEGYARSLVTHSQLRVLLLEMNARRPSMLWRLGLGSGEGVTHYFSEQRPLRTLVQATSLEGLNVVHVGEKDAARIQVHMQQRLPRLLQEALESYDRVIIDAPPVIQCPETPPMAALVDGVVLVVRCERTKREMVQRSMSMIAQFEGKVLGVVLNRKKYYIPDFVYRRL